MLRRVSGTGVTDFAGTLVVWGSALDRCTSVSPFGPHTMDSTTDRAGGAWGAAAPHHDSATDAQILVKTTSNGERA